MQDSPPWETQSNSFRPTTATIVVQKGMLSMNAMQFGSYKTKKVFPIYYMYDPNV